MIKMDPFVVKLLLSFVVGSVWISLLSVFSERLGTRIGGAVAGIPATMVVSIFFIGYTQSSSAAISSAAVVPLMLGINIIYSIIYILLARYNFCAGFFGSLLAWALMSVAPLYLSFGLIASIAFYIIVLVLSVFVYRKLKIRSFKGRKIRYSVVQMLFRAGLSGVLIVAAVLMARFAGPVLGGIFASFPVLTVALILILYRQQGKEYVESILKNFVIGGTLNVLVFILVLGGLVPVNGLLVGTLVSFIISAFFSYVGYNINRWIF